MGGLHNAFDRAETRRRRARILFDDEGGTLTRSKLESYFDGLRTGHTMEPERRRGSALLTCWAHRTAKAIIARGSTAQRIRWNG
jgi:hypothetical protein